MRTLVTIVTLVVRAVLGFLPPPDAGASTTGEFASICAYDPFANASAIAPGETNTPGTLIACRGGAPVVSIDDASSVDRPLRRSCFATNSASGLSDEVLRLAESNITSSGDTVLGSYPGYITKANSRGASYYSIGDTWNTLTLAQRTAANNHFLDVIAGRGDRVLLSTPKMQIQSGTAPADETAYLTGEKGYVWVNQWSLRPGG